MQHSQPIRSPATRLDKLKLDRVVKAPQRICQAQQNQPNVRRLPRLAFRRAAPRSLPLMAQFPVARHQALLCSVVLQSVDAGALLEVGDLVGHVGGYGDDCTCWWQAAGAFGCRGWRIGGARWVALTIVQLSKVFGG